MSDLTKEAVMALPSAIEDLKTVFEIEAGGSG